MGLGRGNMCKLFNMAYPSVQLSFFHYLRLIRGVVMVEDVMLAFGGFTLPSGETGCLMMHGK